MALILYISIAILLLLMNAFFVAAEFAMVKLRNTRIMAIKKIYGWRGKILADIHQQLDSYLSACQLGITLASVGLGWVGEPVFSRLLQPISHYFNLSSTHLITILSFIIAFTIISFLHIVIGELMPKSLAIRQSEAVSLWTSVPLYLFYWTFFPAIWVLNACANFLLKRVGLNEAHRGEFFHTTEEIRLILNKSHLHGELTKEEAAILEHTMDFADIKVTDVMRPQEEMIKLDLKAPIDEILKLITTHRFSRYPVYESTPQQFIGIIHVKDLLPILYEGKSLDSLKPLLRPILKISHRLPALSLLQKFREGMPHFAVVYKGNDTLGFVTLDNLLHILIGKIKDEFHLTQDDWIMNPDGTFIVRGDCSIFTLERALDKDIFIPEQEPALETITALIINQLGHLPQTNAVIDFAEFKAVILKMKGSRILSVKIVPKKVEAM